MTNNRRVETTIARGETILLRLGPGQVVEVTFLGAKGERARVGMRGPQHIPINRGEFQERIDAGKALAAYAG